MNYKQITVNCYYHLSDVHIAKMEKINGLSRKNKNNATEVGLSSRKLGEILLKEELITIGQFQNALKYQQKLKKHMPMGQILVNQKAITQKMLNFVLNRFQKQIRLGDLLVQSGVLTKQQLEVGLKHQKEMGLRLGDALVKLNFITEEVMKQTLCTQLNIPFLDFANIRLQSELSKLINKNYALKHWLFNYNDWKYYDIAHG